MPSAHFVVVSSSVDTDSSNLQFGDTVFLEELFCPVFREKFSDRLWYEPGDDKRSNFEVDKHHGTIS